jgi:hypothetical protein
MTHAHASNSAAKVEKVKRPTISAAGTHEEWAYFTSRWDEYVAATKITGRDVVIQLLECCDEALRKDLTRSTSDKLTDKSAQEVLDAIKKLAVRRENNMVARVALHNMKQDRDEPIRNFCARLRGQACVCNFTVQCTSCQNDVHYTDFIVRDVLAKGIADPDIQLDLLGDKNQDMSLEEVVQFVEAKEAGKRSASRLVDTHAVEASSTYRKAKRSNPTPKQELCSYCGKVGHGVRAPARQRKNTCSAYGHKCTLCSKDHHLESMCRSKGKTQNVSSQDERLFSAYCSDDSMFQNLCVISATYGNRRISIGLDHHLYDNLSDMWVRGRSQPQPYITLSVRVLPEDYDSLGFTLEHNSRVATISAMADTGCQSCLAGIKVIHRLGLKKSDLIPVTMKMHAANNKGINILGATILRISGRNGQGNLVETRQMTYITDESDKLFLSREACTFLGIISVTFPTLGEHNVSQHTNVLEAAKEVRSGPDKLNITCSCSKRELLPPPPDKLPFKLDGDSCTKLKTFLHDYYKASTFNICNHCNRITPSNPSAPPYPLMSPDYPFQCLCAYYFTHRDVNYLVIVDRYSNWPIVEKASGGATGLLTCLR